MNQTTAMTVPPPRRALPRKGMTESRYRPDGGRLRQVYVLASLLLWVFLFLLLLPSGTGAAEPVNLKEAIRVALQNNHEIKSLESGVLAGKADVGIAVSYLLPEIFFEERALRTDNPTYAFMAKLNQERFTASDFDLTHLNNPDEVTDYQTSLSFQQPLFAPKAYIGYGISKKEDQAKQEELLRKREEIAFLVVRTYLGIQTAAAIVRVADQAVDDMKEHLRLAELRFENGLGLYSDVLRATTAVAEAQQKQVTARKNLDLARRALGLLLSQPEEVETGMDHPEIPLHELPHYTEAAAKRKDIRALELRRENARDQIRLADSGYLPTFGVGGTYQLNDHDQPFGTEGESWQMGAYLRWNLFSGGRTLQEKGKATHQARQAEETLAGRKDAVLFGIHEAYLSVDEARKHADLAAAALKTAEEGTRLIRLRYEGSLSPMVDLLDAQTALNQARAGAAAAENAWITAKARLGYESGTILEDLQIEPSP